MRASCPRPGGRLEWDMAFFSRLVGKKDAPAPGTPAVAEPPPAPATPAQPDAAARASEEEAALEAALAGTDAGALAELVLHATSRAVRMRAAEAVEDPDRLRQLIRALRGGGDKNVFRILSARRDALQAAERQAKQLEEEASAVAAAIERHAHRSWDAFYEAQLAQLQQRWDAVVERVDRPMRERVGAGLRAARDIIARHEQAQAEAAAQALAATQAEAESRERGERERAALAAAAEEQSQRQADERAAESQRQQQRTQALEALTATVYRALGALKGGRTAQAARLHEQAREKLAALAEPPARLLKQIEKLDASLAEVREWKAYSVAPKRAELMEQMQRLIGAEVAPQELARRIRHLQETWRTLNRGAGGSLEADGEAFRELAHRAWEPCARYFEQQAQLRNDNLARRTELAGRAESLALEIQAGASPDWRRISRTLAEMHREWRRYLPVDREAAQPVQARFNAAARLLHERLDTEYDRNVRARRAIIDRAAALLGEPDSRQAIIEIKALQARWKDAGPVPHERSEALWQEFRQHCDALFQKRAEQSASFAATLDSNQARAGQLCDELESLCTLGLHDLQASGAARLESLRQEFDALELPRQSARSLRQRFQRIESRLHAALERAQVAREELVWTHLLDAADRVRRYAIGRTDALHAEAAAFIESVPHWPRGGRAIIEQQLQRTGAIVPGAVPGADAGPLRDLCIRAELLADLPTPDEDLTRRREHQMKRLVQGMGRGSTPERGDFEALMLEWIDAPPVADDVYAPLRQRFDRCRDRLAEITRRRD